MYSYVFVHLSKYTSLCTLPRGIRVRIIATIVYTVCCRQLAVPARVDHSTYTRIPHSRNLISTKLPLHSKQPENPDKVLKYLAHLNPGCDWKVLLLLYSSVIRSVLNYSSPVYGLAPPSHLSLLDPVQNAVTIRICTGSFRTSPQFSLCAEAGVLPSEYHWLSLTANLLSSILLLPKTQIHNVLNSLCHRPVYCKAFT